MQDWHLYIIRCHDGSLYTGVTVDVERRFREHQAQGRKCAKYLKGKAPLALVFQSCIGEKRKAYQLEWNIKRLSRPKKEALLQGKIALSALIKQK
ncbi:MAG: GIY-YIG nuclease family protein [Sinomicrobium sp.]|nr:GIY-YIG nuclease family protein [Sinomicrobium sp.]